MAPEHAVIRNAIKKIQIVASDAIQAVITGGNIVTLKSISNNPTMR
jgi:hypothetical protein